MSTMASQIISLTIVYSAVYSGTDHRNHQSSASLAFVRGIHRWPVNSPHKGPVTRKMFPFDDVIMPHVYHNISYIIILYHIIYRIIYVSIWAHLWLNTKEGMFAMELPHWSEHELKIRYFCIFKFHCFAIKHQLTIKISIRFDWFRRP